MDKPIQIPDHKKHERKHVYNELVERLPIYKADPNQNQELAKLIGIRLVKNSVPSVDTPGFWAQTYEQIG